MTKIDPEIPLIEAIRIAGNQANLARILEVSKTMVTSWKRSGAYLPPLHGYRFRELYPDVKNNSAREAHNHD